jgi:hypothetical protein
MVDEGSSVAGGLCRVGSLQPPSSYAGNFEVQETSR